MILIAQCIRTPRSSSPSFHFYISYHSTQTWVFCLISVIVNYWRQLKAMMRVKLRQTGELLKLELNPTTLFLVFLSL